nr:uncharacterized protein LOC106685485 [Halyomorpha halys]
MFDNDQEISVNYAWSMYRMPPDYNFGSYDMTDQRSIHSIKDLSGHSLISYHQGRHILVDSSLRKNCRPERIPGENYTPCSRFKRILHDSCIPAEKPKTIITNCVLCDGPMKIKLSPTGGKKKLVVNEVWGKPEGTPENPKIQQLFDTWLYSKSTKCPKESEKKKSTFRKVHHYYHHNMIKTIEPHVESEKFAFCAGCPDRFRGWKRNSTKPDHYIEPMLLLCRKSKVENQKHLKLQPKGRDDNTFMLKEALSRILKSDFLPSSITVSLCTDFDVMVQSSESSQFP